MNMYMYNIQQNHPYFIYILQLSEHIVNLILTDTQMINTMIQERASDTNNRMDAYTSFRICQTLHK